MLTVLKYKIHSHLQLLGFPFAFFKKRKRKKSLQTTGIECPICSGPHWLYTYTSSSNAADNSVTLPTEYMNARKSETVEYIKESPSFLILKQVMGINHKRKEVIIVSN